MTINCAGKLVDLSTPKIMGILNVTPDSFYDGGVHNSDKKILKHVEKMLNDGAVFIDIGAYSSRPNGKNIDENEELNRVIPGTSWIYYISKYQVEVEFNDENCDLDDN